MSTLDKGALYRATKKLHHAVENTTYLGRVMVTTVPSYPDYMWWLGMKLPIYSRLALYSDAPEAANTAAKLLDDMISLHRRFGLPIAYHPVTTKFADTLETDEQLLGAAYVTIGGASTGGRILRARLEPLRYPVTNFYYEDEAEISRFVKSLRPREDLISGAFACFTAYLHACNQQPTQADVRIK